MEEPHVDPLVTLEVPHCWVLSRGNNLDCCGVILEQCHLTLSFANHIEEVQRRAADRFDAHIR